MSRKENKLNKKLVGKVQQSIDKAVKKHDLIRPNDKILVGLSGGIDSIVLLHNLANKKNYYDFDFELRAVYINIENIPYSVNTDLLNEFCDQNNVELTVVNQTIEIDNSKITTNPCFICSWQRRKLLFNYSKEHNFNKLALGHHRDDAIETFMMNLVYHGTISSLPAKLSMFDGRMELIRPMIYLTKEQILEYAKIKELNPQVKTCKFDEKTNRRKLDVIIQEMKKFNPQARKNIFKAMSHIHEEYLPK